MDIDLPKEVLVILFKTFPGHFVLIGGGALHWIFNSPRLSADIDLKLIGKAPAKLLEKMAEALTKRLSLLSPPGTTLHCQADQKAQAVRIAVNGRPALQVELVTLAPVTGKEKHLLQSASLQSEIIVTPTIHQLLFAKAAALIQRPHLKGRDVFDIWFLEGRGAALDVDKFSDWLKWEEKDAQDLKKRLQQITPARLQADLARFLPESIQRSLAEDGFKPLIDAAERLWKPFL